MMSLFGGIAHAPLAVMIMVAEMTGNLSLLAPAMIAVAVSTALVGDNTFYRAQLRDRASSPFYRLQYRFPLLSSLLVRDAMAPLPAEAQRGADVQGADAARRSFVLVDEPLVVENGKVIGTLSVTDAVKAYRRART